MTEIVVKVKSLVKQYGSLKAVDDISLTFIMRALAVGFIILGSVVTRWKEK